MSGPPGQITGNWRKNIDLHLEEKNHMKFRNCDIMRLWRLSDFVSRLDISQNKDTGIVRDCEAENESLGIAFAQD